MDFNGNEEDVFDEKAAVSLTPLSLRGVKEDNQKDSLNGCALR